MSRYQVRPITVTRDVLTACDPTCRFYPNFQGGDLTDASCDARGTGFVAVAGGGSFVDGGYLLDIDEDATNYTQNGVAWTIPFIADPLEDLTYELLVRFVGYVDDPWSIQPTIAVWWIGQSEFTSNYLFAARINPYTNRAVFNLAFVGSSSEAVIVPGQDIHFCIQKPGKNNVSAENPERYFINGQQVLTRNTRHNLSGIDTMLFGGHHGSAPRGGVLSILYKQARISTGFRYPHTGASFARPTSLTPPRWFTGLGDPVVTVGNPVTPDLDDAGTYTPAQARPWGTEVLGSQTVAAAVDTSGEAEEDAPLQIPTQVSWSVDFPPYPASTPPSVGITFDATSWQLTAQVTTQFRNRAVVAGGQFIPQTFYSDPAAFSTENGLKQLEAAAAADCADLPGWIQQGLSKIGGFLVPEKGACPPVKDLPDATSPFLDEEPVAGMGNYIRTTDCAIPVYVGRQSDQFTLTIESIGYHPMTISGVDWTGWFYNNTRRI